MTTEPELREIGAGVFAYLQRGSWGYSNAGLITGAPGSLLVDTLYDLALTHRMLERMRPLLGSAPLESVVNTHANGDHCWGNQAVGSAKIVSSKATAEEMRELSPRLMHTLVQAARGLTRLGPVGVRPLRLLGRLGVARAAALADAASLVVEAFGDFEFGGLRLRIPDQTFEGRLELEVGDKRVELLELGPAHTRGDAIVHVPSERVVYSGDLVFMDSHPIAWEGPVDHWIAACDRILALEPRVVVPGHGPLTDATGVRQMRDYWLRLKAHAKATHAAGISAEEAAQELAREFPWGEAERLVVNLDTLYRELNGDRSPRDPLRLLGDMGRATARLRSLAGR